MDTITLVDEQIQEGQRLLRRLAQDGVPLRAAGWVKPTSEDRWSLYLVTPLVEEQGPLGAYREVLTRIRSLGLVEVNSSSVKMVGDKDQVAKDLMGLVGERPVRRLPRHVHTLGGFAVDGVHIYPAPRPVTKWDDAHPLGTRRVRLKTEVEQKLSVGEFLEPLTPQEELAVSHIVSSGVSPAQAEYYVRKRREMLGHKPPIPAGTVVEARVVAWGGEAPEDDPNPLLEVEAPDGTQGFTFQEDVEPV